MWPNVIEISFAGKTNWKKLVKNGQQTFYNRKLFSTD